MITAKTNSYIKLARSLLEDAKARKRQRLFIAEGSRLCADAAASGVKIRFALYTEQAAHLYPDTITALRDSGAECFSISDTLSHMLADTVTPQGIFCVGEWLDNSSGREKAESRISTGGCALALEAIRDPSNMGTIIRTAEAFGADALFISGDCCDVYSPKVIRGSMGGIFRLPVFDCGEMPDAVSGWRKRGICCAACVVSGGTPIDKADTGVSCIAVIGNEATGLRPETTEVCDIKLTIPMRGRAESLNASMAAGIVLWKLCGGV